GHGLVVIELNARGADTGLQPETDRLVVIQPDTAGTEPRLQCWPHPLVVSQRAAGLDLRSDLHSALLVDDPRRPCRVTHRSGQLGCQRVLPAIPRWSAGYRSDLQPRRAG